MVEIGAYRGTADFVFVALSLADSRDVDFANRTFLLAGQSRSRVQDEEKNSMVP